MFFYRFSFIYIYNRPGIRVEIEIKSCKTAKIGVKVLLLETFLTNLFLLR